MDTHNNTTFKSVELFDWDPNWFDDDIDFLNPERTQTVKSTQHNLMSNNIMEYSSQESTSSAFSTQTSITSTQDNFSQNNKMEYSSQESMSSMNISSQESSVCDKMHISSQETSLDKVESELKKTDETEFTCVPTNDPYSRMPDVYEQCGITSSYKTEHYPQSIARNAQNTRVSSPVKETAEETISDIKGTKFSLHEGQSSSHETLPYSKTKNLSAQGISYNIGNFGQDAKSQNTSVSELILSEKTEIQIGMNISSSRKFTNLTKPILSKEKEYPKITSSENMSILATANEEDRGHEICPLNEDYKIQSSINFCTQEKCINCEAMSISSQGSSGSQAMDISSQEIVDRNEEVIFEINNLKKNEIPKCLTRSIEEPFLAKKRYCCSKGFQIQKSIFNIRKIHKTVMKRENALKNRETRVAEREAAILRREEVLKAREQKILNYEAAIFHSVK